MHNRKKPPPPNLLVRKSNLLVNWSSRLTSCKCQSLDHFRKCFFLLLFFFQHVLGYVPKFPQKKMGFLLYFVSSPPPPLPLHGLEQTALLNPSAELERKKNPLRSKKKQNPLYTRRQNVHDDDEWWWMMGTNMMKAETSLAWPGDPLISWNFIPWSQQHLLDLPSSPTSSSYIHTHTNTHTQTLFSAPPCFFFFWRERVNAYTKSEGGCTSFSSD